MMILYIKLQLNEFRKPNGTRRRNSKSKKEKKNEIKIKEKINKKSALKSFLFLIFFSWSLSLRQTMDYNKRRKWKCHQPKGRDTLIYKRKIINIKVQNIWKFSKLAHKKMSFFVYCWWVFVKCLTSIKKVNTILKKGLINN